MNDAGLEERPEEEVEGGARYTGQWRGKVWHGKGCLTRPRQGMYRRCNGNSCKVLVISEAYATDAIIVPTACMLSSSTLLSLTPRHASTEL